MEVKLFLRLSVTCLLISVALLCYPAFESGGWRKRESTNLFASIQTVLVQTNVHCLSLAKRTREGFNVVRSTSHGAIKSVLCFPFMNNHMKHFAHNVHFIMKTKSFPITNETTIHLRASGSYVPSSRKGLFRPWVGWCIQYRDSTTVTFSLRPFLTQMASHWGLS